MRYRSRRRPWRKGFVFPFVLPFLIISFSHSTHAFFISILSIVIVMFIIRAITAARFSTQQFYYQAGQSQQSYYQPPQAQQSYYQPPQAEYYQPYNQGYQAPEQTHRSTDGPKAPAPATYDQYEQPQAQYPEQLPPMQQ